MIKNSLFLVVSGGMGDAFMAFIIALILSKKNIYDTVFYIFDNVHFNGMMDFFNKFNISKNIIFLTNPIYNNDKSFKIIMDYITIYENNYNFKNNYIQFINDNYYYLIPNLEIQPHDNKYYNNLFKILNINLSEINNLIIFNEEISYDINKNNLNKVYNKVGKKYICVFHEDHRYNGIFWIKYYNSEFNKNNYPIIFFNNIDKFIIGNNFFISDILGNIKPLFEYHDIIANAQEIHCVNSFVSCYFNTIFQIIPEKFKNVKKYIYPRFLFGINNNIDKYILNINNINTFEIHNFYNFKCIIPLNYFTYKINPKFVPNCGIYEYGCEFKPLKILNYGNTNMFSDSKFIEYDKYDEYSLNISYFNKIIINCNSLNVLGILDKNDITKKSNFIWINMITNVISEYGGLGRIKNISTYENINNDLDEFIKDPKIYLNIIFIKNDKSFYITIDERKLDNNFNIISNDNIIHNYDIEYCKILTSLNENEKISYIFPFINDDQFFKWEWFYYNLICIYHNNLN